MTRSQMRRLVLVVAAIGVGCIAAGRARAAQLVGFAAEVPPGTILIRQSERQLYLIRGTAPRSVIRSRSANPANNGSAGRRSTANTSSRPGGRLRTSSETIRVYPI